ncbi:FliH/SctL family protein [Anoxynatronum sibiricum]|uniref:FliH/SctL family protein n=2 Tax=Anoxynatronum sibiricum TaxID=210623 RepID=A0ABU9VQJ6_9CLOT
MVEGMTLLYKIYKSSQLQIGDKIEIKARAFQSQKKEITLPENDDMPNESYPAYETWHQERESIISKAEEESTMLIEQAEKEAAEILEKSYQDSLKALEQAKEEGYHAGFEAGSAEGKESGYQETMSILLEAKQLKQQAIDERNRLAKELESQIVQLVIQTSRRVIQSEMQDNQESIFTLIEEGLKKCNYTENLVIHVSEMDYDLVYAYQNRIYLMTEGIYDIEVKSDPSMSPGSVVIETASGQVDAGIETQLRQIEAAFTELLKSGDD